MATRPCPSCGAETLPEARFCRRCGATLRAAAGDGAATGEIEPLPPTVLLPADPSTADDLDTPGAAFDPYATRYAGAPETPPAASDPVAAPAGPHGTTADESAAEPDFGGYDDERTVAVARRVEPLGSGPTYGRRGPTYEPPAGDDEAIEDDDEDDDSHHHPRHQAQPPAPRRWPVVLALCLSFLLFAAAGALFAARYLAGRGASRTSTLPPVPPPPADPKQLFEEKMAEAEALLAQGDMDAALARLREAAALDPSNTRAHRRLGEILFDTGARGAAIESFRAVTRNAPQDFTAWRQLAAAQFAEGLYRDAAESYRRVVSLVGEQSADAQDLLSYADALRLSDRPEEARKVYERLANVPYALVADAARARLSELTAPTPEPTPEPSPEADGEGRPAEGSGEDSPPAAPAPTPAVRPAPQPPAPPQQPRPPASSASDPYRRGLDLWPTDRAAATEAFREAARAGNPDAHYYLGLSYVLGRDLRTLKRAEVVAALDHFQRAERGQFAEQSRRYTRQLGQEFDRLRVQD
jgi:tetratricopeptide (TPR) repeat protein